MSWLERISAAGAAIGALTLMYAALSHSRRSAKLLTDIGEMLRELAIHFPAGSDSVTKVILGIQGAQDLQAQVLAQLRRDVNAYTASHRQDHADLWAVLAAHDIDRRTITLPPERRSP